MDWGSWSTTTINSSSVSNSSSSTTGAISNDEKTACEVSVTIDYGTTADAGVKVYVLRDADGTNYEAAGDDPWMFEMPFSISTTHRRTFSVSPSHVSSFKVSVQNDSGATVTATVRYKQAT